MYCPNCGIPAQEAQNFCKRCGANLSLVNQALTGKLQSTDLSRRAQKARTELSKGLRRACWGFGLMIFAGLIIEAPPLAIIAFFFFLSGAGRVAAALADPANQNAIGAMSRSLRKLYGFETSRLSRRKRSPQSKAHQTDAPSMSAAPPPSVTEHTTVHLGGRDFAPPRHGRQRNRH